MTETQTTNEPHTRLRHSLTEDAMAFVVGTAMCALGLASSPGRRRALACC